MLHTGMHKFQIFGILYYNFTNSEAAKAENYTLELMCIACELTRIMKLYCELNVIQPKTHWLLTALKANL